MKPLYIPRNTTNFRLLAATLWGILPKQTADYIRYSFVNKHHQAQQRSNMFSTSDFSMELGAEFARDVMSKKGMPDAYARPFFKALKGVILNLDNDGIHAGYGEGRLTLVAFHEGATVYETDLEKHRRSVRKWINSQPEDE